VLYIEHKILLGVKGEVPEGEHYVPIGKATVAREGSDVTIITWSAMVQKALAAAETLDKEGVSAEVLDLRTISPLDKEAILKSVEKTGRAIILHEATLTGGVGGEIAAIIADEGFDYLNAPIKRVAAPDCPIPFSPVLEQAWVPNEEKVIAAVKQVV